MGTNQSEERGVIGGFFLPFFFLLGKISQFSPLKGHGFNNKFDSGFTKLVGNIKINSFE